MWPLETDGTFALQFIIKRLKDLWSLQVLLMSKLRFSKGKGSVMNSMYVVTSNRSEMKHYGGKNIT